MADELRRQVYQLCGSALFQTFEPCNVMMCYTCTMRPTITATRAIGTEFARRALRPLTIIGVVAAIVLLSLGGWLTTQSAWWWLLEIVFIGGSLIFVLLIIIVNVILRGVEPPLSKAQREAVDGFVDKLERVAESLGTPQIVIIYYVTRDTIRPRPNGFIETVSRDSKALAPDFVRLRQEFE
jgi:MFS family permease